MDDFIKNDEWLYVKYLTVGEPCGVDINGTFVWVEAKHIEVKLGYAAIVSKSGDGWGGLYDGTKKLSEELRSGLNRALNPSRNKILLVRNRPVISKDEMTLSFVLWCDAAIINLQPEQKKES